MPIADLFAPASSKPVGTGRDGRDTQQPQGIALSRPVATSVGTVGTPPTGAELCPDCPDLPAPRSGHENSSVSAVVPTVPTVPTVNEQTCQRCGAAPLPKELGAADLAGWICERCMDGGQRYVVLPTAAELPGKADPLGKCSGCRFTAPLSPRRLCGRCEVEHLFAAAERVLAGVIATSDEGEFLRADDEP